MRATSRPLFALALSTVFFACSGGTPTGGAGGSSSLAGPGPAPDAIIGTPLASVNGAPVGSLAFDAIAQRTPPADGTAFSADEKTSLLDQAVVDELLFQEAFRRGLYHDPKVRKILVTLLLRTEVYDNVRNEDFNEEQLKAYFDSHKDEFIVPEKVQVKRIFLAVGPERDQAAAETLAASLAAKIKADPEQFAQLALENSNDPFARRGGDLGYVGADGKPGVPPEVITKALALDVGQVSEPFLAGGGVNIVYSANKRERLERTFEQMRGSVLRKVKNDRFEELSKGFIEKLRGSAKIDVDADKLTAYSPAPPARPGNPLQGIDGAPAAPEAAPTPSPEGAPAAAPAEEGTENAERLRARGEEDGE